MLEERADRGVYAPLLEDPVAFGLITPRLLCGPTVRGNLLGARVLARRLNAAIHWRTCAGSFASYRSTVRKTSCGGRLSGGSWHARKKCEIFSICTNGADNFLYFTPGDTARFTSLVIKELARGLDPLLEKHRYNLLAKSNAIFQAFE